jgi:HAD superfamily hydrolase (TIGR01549 family)
VAYDSLLLDHDGVLVRILDKERRVPAFRQELIEMFRADGVEPPPADVITTLSHSVTYDEVLHIGDRLDLDPDRLWRYRDDTFANVLIRATDDGQKRPYEDVQALERLDVPLGIASNNQRRVVEHMISRYDIDTHVETIHARQPRLQSLREKKPRPTYLQRAMRDLGVSNPLYVGDRESDIVAGQRAGLDTAFVRRDHNAEITPRRDPTHEVSGLNDVATLFIGDRH